MIYSSASYTHPVVDAMRASVERPSEAGINNMLLQGLRSSMHMATGLSAQPSISNSNNSPPQQQQASSTWARGSARVRPDDAWAEPATLPVADSVEPNVPPRDRIVEVVGYHSAMTTTGFGQVNGFELQFEGGGKLLFGKRKGRRDTLRLGEREALVRVAGRTDLGRRQRGASSSAPMGALVSIMFTTSKAREVIFGLVQRARLEGSFSFPAPYRSEICGLHTLSPEVPIITRILTQPRRLSHLPNAAQSLPALPLVSAHQAKAAHHQRQLQQQQREQLQQQSQQSQQPQQEGEHDSDETMQVERTEGESTPPQSPPPQPLPPPPPAADTETLALTGLARSEAHMRAVIRTVDSMQRRVRHLRTALFSDNSGGGNGGGPTLQQHERVTEAWAPPSSADQPTDSNGGGSGNGAELLCGLEAEQTLVRQHLDCLIELHTCIVCLDRPIGGVLVPCGHLCLCLECAGRLRVGNACPLCRAPATAFSLAFGA